MAALERASGAAQKEGAMTTLTLIAAAVLAGAASLPASAAEKEPYSHKDAFEHYEGTRTCLACHRKEAESFFGAQHYQWRGNAPQIVGAGARKLGKLNTINDFCTGPAANWIGLVKNSRGADPVEGLLEVSRRPGQAA